MKEVRFHGRGGQGAVTAARLLASAMFKEGMKVQAFPFFGMERRGAPVQAFLRFSRKEPIAVRTYVYTPDYVVVLDPTLFKSVDMLKGLKPNGMLIVNTSSSPSKLKVNVNKLAVVDAISISLKTLGVPIVNTTMLGAFASATKEVSLTSIAEVIKERLPERLVESNIKAVEEGYRETKLYHSDVKINNASCKKDLICSG